MGDFDPDYGRFWSLTQRLVALMERAVERRLRAELGVSSTQYRVLSAVQIQEGDLIQQDVAMMLGTTGATVSRQIDAAVRQGYVTVKVSSSSRRENTVELTSLGHDVVRRGDAIIAEESAIALATVSPSDFATTFEAVRRMVDTISSGHSSSRD